MANGKASEADEYMLKRSHVASARLNLQHSMWLDNFDRRLLHQNIPVVNAKGLKVADVGTGTGIWLLDFACQYPEAAQLDGLDISLDQAPPAGFLPSNVSFREYNVFDEPSSDLILKYDIIHVRHLQIVVKQDDPLPIMKNILKMLRPGGYIQWGEYEMTEQKAITAAPECSTIELVGFFKRLKEVLQSYEKSWTGELAEYLNQSGLQDVHLERVMPRGTHAYIYMATSLLAYEEIIDAYARLQRAQPEVVEELRSRLVKAGAEVRGGAAWSVPRLQAVGRKPTESEMA